MTAGRGARLGWRAHAAEADADQVRAMCIAYVDALTAGDRDVLQRLRASDAVTDFVHGDAFGSGELDPAGADRVWADWFAAFPERRLDLVRSLIGASVAVLEWSLTVRHLGDLRPPIVARTVPPSGRRATFRGVTILDMTAGAIQRETIHLDYVTLLVALGVRP